ncbi:TIR domain-containing protein [Vibrio fluvialis]
MEKRNIFISYSWDNDEHKEWTRKLADRLEEYSEIHVVFDQYDLDSFSDKNFFMEKGVFDTDILLIIVTKEYVNKANNRLGGAGIETKMSTARHWEESLNGNDSNIIPILREGGTLPNYLKEKFYVDFRKDDMFEKSISYLLRHIKNESKVKRPKKTKSLSNNVALKNFTRVEDFLKINHKKKKLVFDKEFTTDFSAGNRIKFELWETQSPAKDYYLFLFDNIIIKPTIERLCSLIKSNNIKISRLTVLKSAGSEKGYLKKIFIENNINVELNELTFSDYIWEYCIDDEAKINSDIYKTKFFIDQPLISNDEQHTELGPAFDFIKTQFDKEEQSSAKIIIAPGGTGKTTLCQYIASHYQNPESAVSVFIQSEALRANANTDIYDSVKIESVYDLYEIYSKVIREDSTIYDRTTFEVALLTGKLVLVIDGMDEIISLFPEGFNLDGFLESIDKLNSELASCRIIITSRNDVFDQDTIESYERLTKYNLLGFDLEACNQYLKRRFRGFEFSDVMIKKVTTNIEPLISSDENKRILPFVIDLLSSLVEDSVEDNDLDIQLSFRGKTYESNTGIIDYLVYSILRREHERQQIEIPIEDVLDIFLEITSTHKDSFTRNDFIDTVSIFFSGDIKNLSSKLLRNPLLLIDDNDTCRFRYDFISDYFKSIRIIHSINNKDISSDFIKLLSKNVYSDGEIVDEVIKYFKENEQRLLSSSQHIISNIKSSIKLDEVHEKNDSNFRAIAFLIRLISNLSGTSISKKEFTEKILTVMGGGNTIKHLSIYGNDRAFDFSNLDVVDSKFIGYKKFTSSNFENTSFRNCYFDSIFNDVIPERIHSGMFTDCRLGDLEMVIDNFQEKSFKTQELLEKELRNFLSSFFNRGKFKDQKISYIKMSTRIKTINKTFLNKLIKEDIICVKSQKSDETYYAISSHYQDSVYAFLNNSRIDRKISKIIELVDS